MLLLMLVVVVVVVVRAVGAVDVAVSSSILPSLLPPKTRLHAHLHPVVQTPSFIAFGIA